MTTGSRVRTAVDLPGIAAGSEGVITELGRVFIAVQFADGHMGYYASRQLVPVPEPADGLPVADLLLADLGNAGSRLPYGSHICFLPAADETPFHTPARYLCAGLAAGDICLAIAPSHWRAQMSTMLHSYGQDPGHAQASRDLVLLDIWDYYCPPAEFTADRQIERLGEALGRAAVPGRRLRVFGHGPARMTGLDQDEWRDYEQRCTPILGEAKALTLCSYAELPEHSPLAEVALTTHRYVLSQGDVAAL